MKYIHIGQNIILKFSAHLTRQRLNGIYFLALKLQNN